MKRLLLLLILTIGWFSSNAQSPMRTNGIQFRGQTGADPSSFESSNPNNATIYWNYGTQKWRVFDGTTWSDLATGTGGVSISLGSTDATDGSNGSLTIRADAEYLSVFDQEFDLYYNAGQDVTVLSLSDTFKNSLFTWDYDYADLINTPTITDDQDATEINLNPSIDTETTVQAILEKHETRIDNLVSGGGADGVISNVALNTNSLDFTGANGGFNGSVDLSQYVNDGYEANTDSQGLTWVDGTNTIEISGGTNAVITGFLESEVDGSVTNEIQAVTNDQVVIGTGTNIEGDADFTFNSTGNILRLDSGSLITNLTSNALHYAIRLNDTNVLAFGTDTAGGGLISQQTADPLYIEAPLSYVDIQNAVSENTVGEIDALPSDAFVTKDWVNAQSFGSTPLSTITANTGTTISLANAVGNYCNMASANATTTYTTTGAVDGGWAQVLINAASEPTITGATKEAIGSAFVTNTDMYMNVVNDGNSVRYWFIGIALSGGVSELSDLTDVNTSTPTNRNVLVADGVDWESRALVEADISDLSHTTNTDSQTLSYTFPNLSITGGNSVDLTDLRDGTGLSNIVEDLTPQLGGQLDVNGKTISSVGNLDIEIDNLGDINTNYQFRIMRQSTPLFYIQEWTQGIEQTALHVAPSGHQGVIHLYGDTGAHGGGLYFYNDDSHDTTVDIWGWAAGRENNGDLTLFADSTENILNIDETTLAVTAQQTSIADINALGDKALITKEWVDAQGFGAGSGDDVSTFSEKTGALVGTDRLVGLSGATDFSETISGIPLSIFNNDSGWTSNTGDVTLNGTQTLTNKTISGDNNTIQNINLTTQITGNLGTGNLNDGIGASASTFWRGDGTWATPAGSGDVSKVGTPVDNQIGIWTGDGTIEGVTGLTYNAGVLFSANGNFSTGVLTPAVQSNSADLDLYSQGDMDIYLDQGFVGSKAFRVNFQGSSVFDVNQAGTLSTRGFKLYDATDLAYSELVTDDNYTIWKNTSGQNVIGFEQGNFSVFANGGVNSGQFVFSALTGLRNYTMQDASGTVAFTSDIPSTAITDNQVVVGTGTGIEGTASLTYDGTALDVTGDVIADNGTAGKITLADDTITIDYSTISGDAQITAVKGANQTILEWVDPTSSNKILIPDSSGTMALTSDISNQESIQIACSDLTTDLTTGTTKAYFRMPYAMTVTEVRASVLTAPTGATLIVDINDSGTTIMTTNKLSIDASEKTSETAVTSATVTDSALADDSEITIDIDQVGSTVAGAGLIVTITGNRI